MACRKRKPGLYGASGGTMSSRNKTTNTELYNMVNELREEVKDLKHENEYSNKNTNEYLKFIDKNQNKIKKNQNWHIFLSATMPLIAPKIAEGIGKLLNGNTPEDVEEFSRKIEPILKNAPEELKEQILSVTKNYFEQQDEESKNEKAEEEDFSGSSFV